MPEQGPQTPQSTGAAKSASSTPHSTDAAASASPTPQPPPRNRTNSRQLQRLSVVIDTPPSRRQSLPQRDRAVSEFADAPNSPFSSEVQQKLQPLLPVISEMYQEALAKEPSDFMLLMFLRNFRTVIITTEKVDQWFDPVKCSVKQLQDQILAFKGSYEANVQQAAACKPLPFGDASVAEFIFYRLDSFLSSISAITKQECPAVELDAVFVAPELQKLTPSDVLKDFLQFVRKLSPRFDADDLARSGSALKLETMLDDFTTIINGGQINLVIRKLLGYLGATQAYKNTVKKQKFKTLEDAFSWLQTDLSAHKDNNCEAIRLLLTLQSFIPLVLGIQTKHAASVVCKFALLVPEDRDQAMQAYIFQRHLSYAVTMKIAGLKKGPIAPEMHWGCGIAGAEKGVELLVPRTTVNEFLRDVYDNISNTEIPRQFYGNTAIFQLAGTSSPYNIKQRSDIILQQAIKALQYLMQHWQLSAVVMNPNPEIQTLFRKRVMFIVTQFMHGRFAALASSPDSSIDISILACLNILYEPCMQLLLPMFAAEQTFSIGEGESRQEGLHLCERRFSFEATTCAEINEPDLGKLVALIQARNKKFAVDEDQSNIKLLALYLHDPFKGQQLLYQYLGGTHAKLLKCEDWGHWIPLKLGQLASDKVLRAMDDLVASEQFAELYGDYAQAGGHVMPLEMYRWFEQQAATVLLMATKEFHTVLDWSEQRVSWVKNLQGYQQSANDLNNALAAIVSTFESYKTTLNKRSYPSDCAFYNNLQVKNIQNVQSYNPFAESNQLSYIADMLGYLSAPFDGLVVNLQNQFEWFDAMVKDSMVVPEQLQSQAIQCSFLHLQIESQYLLSMLQQMLTVLDEWPSLAPGHGAEILELQAACVQIQQQWTEQLNVLFQYVFATKFQLKDFDPEVMCAALQSLDSSIVNNLPDVPLGWIDRSEEFKGNVQTVCARAQQSVIDALVSYAKLHGMSEQDAVSLGERFTAEAPSTAQAGSRLRSRSRSNSAEGNTDVTLGQDAQPTIR